MQKITILLLILTPTFTTILDDKKHLLGEDYELYSKLPKLDPRNLEEIIKGFNSVMDLMVLHKSPKGLDLSHKGNFERVLSEVESSENNESFMEKVDGQLMGLKGDIKQSEGLTSQVGEVLDKAKGYFNQVKEAKDNLMNPGAMIGNAVSGALGGAVGNIAGSFGFRRRLEEEEENCKKPESIF